jgi:hypothetical protein
MNIDWDNILVDENSEQIVRHIPRQIQPSKA